MDLVFVRGPEEVIFREGLVALKEPIGLCFQQLTPFTQGLCVSKVDFPYADWVD